MARRLALLLFFASVLPLAQATQSAAGPPMLSQNEEGNPEAVVAWLKENGAKADKGLAQRAFEDGLQRKRRKDWGAAIKGFGDSVAFYPTPRALNEYTEATLRMLHQLKPRNKPSPEDQRRHLAMAAATYRSALAADSILNQLTAQERQQTQQNVDCLVEYLRSSKPLRNCRPLEMYGVKTGSATQGSKPSGAKAGSRMKTLSLALGESDSKLILEALLALEQRWDERCSSSDDPDEIADIGNDLIELRLLIKSYKEQSVAALGPGVLQLGREAV